MTAREEIKALRGEIAELREQLAGLEQIVGHVVRVEHHHHYPLPSKPAVSPFQPFPTPLPYYGNTC